MAHKILPNQDSTRLDSTRLARERENVVVAVVVCRRRAHLMMRGSVVFPSTTTTRIYAKGHVCVCVCVCFSSSSSSTYAGTSTVVGI